MTRTITNLYKDWNYCSDFDESMTDWSHAVFEKVSLPHTNIMLPYNYFNETVYQFISCYKKSFDLQPACKRKRVFVDFEGVASYAKLYVNGHNIGEHKGGYTPFSFEITDEVHHGSSNELTVIVDSKERDDIPPFGYEIDYLTYGGIYREAYLRIVDPIFIENAFVRTADVLDENRKLDISLFVNNGTNAAENMLVNVRLKGPEGYLLERRVNVMADQGKSRADFSICELGHIQLWDLDHPYLYEIEFECSVPGIATDIYTTKIGFRDAKVREDGFYLNGRKVKLRGLNRHQSFPYVGYAMPERVQKKDAEILKYQLKLNVVRTSHYPQSRHFLDRCDEIGLLVFEEIPGWQHIGDEKWKETAYTHVKEMIERDRNRPSVFIWGIRINESGDDHDFYTETNRIAREWDPSRQTTGVRCITSSELLEDVYSMNDFIHTGEEIALRDQKEVTGLDRYVPYLVTEFNGHMFPTKRFDQEERLVEHAMRHLRVHDAVGQDPHISGAIGWCAFDYNTHLGFGSGDRICYHGVMDMFRIPKFAAAFYRSQDDPRKEAVLEPMTLWTRGERSGGGIRPLVIFTNCDEIKLYIGGTYKGTFKPEREQYAGVEYPPVMISRIEGEWGDHWHEGEFAGYVSGTEVIRRKFSPDPVPVKLKAEADDVELISDRPDATRIVYTLVDQEGNLLPFIPEYIDLTISGPGDILGPHRTALIGGCIAVWIRALDKGVITVSAQCSQFRAEDVVISVH